MWFLHCVLHNNNYAPHGSFFLSKRIKRVFRRTILKLYSPKNTQLAVGLKGGCKNFARSWSRAAVVFVVVTMDLNINHFSNYASSIILFYPYIRSVCFKHTSYFPKNMLQSHSSCSNIIKSVLKQNFKS